MTNEQAAKIIALLESIDHRLESVITDESNIPVVVQNDSITVDTERGRPLEVYDAKF